ncbi:MAG: kelch repeat-containing protein [Leptospirales bacterium]
MNKNRLKLLTTATIVFVSLWNLACVICPPGGGSTDQRMNHSATLLSDGKVLIAGGENDFSLMVYTSAQIYDPATGLFTETGSMIRQREGHKGILLLDGRVLIIGGYNGAYEPLTDTEIYDPATGVFTASGSMIMPRHAYTATILQNGKVLITGGSSDPWQDSTATAELFDPVTGTFSLTGSMMTVRESHTATLLSNGQVLIAGGQAEVGNQHNVLASAELYDTTTGKFTTSTTVNSYRDHDHNVVIGSLGTARYAHMATLLLDGRVLITGGSLNYDRDLRTSELYDPVTGAFTSTGSLLYAEGHHTQTLLPTGEVLLTDYYCRKQCFVTKAELYNLTTGTFTPAGTLKNERNNHTATLLGNGMVLFVGGSDTRQMTRYAELYDPRTSTFSETGY